MEKILHDAMTWSMRYAAFLKRRRAGPSEEAIHRLEHFWKSLQDASLDPLEVLSGLNEYGSDAMNGILSLTVGLGLSRLRRIEFGDVDQVDSLGIIHFFHVDLGN